MNKIEVTEEPPEARLTPEELKAIVAFNIKQIRERIRNAKTIGEVVMWEDEITRIKQELKKELSKFNN